MRVPVTGGVQEGSLSGVYEDIPGKSVCAAPLLLLLIIWYLSKRQCFPRALLAARF